MTAKERIPIYLNALANEFKEVSKFPKKKFKLTEGQLIKQNKDESLFKFKTEQLIVTIDDSIGKLIYKEIEYSCNIVTVENFEVELVIFNFKESFVSEALLVLDLSYLIESLIKKYKEIKTEELEDRFLISDKIFNSESEIISKSLPTYKNNSNALLNESQELSVLKSFQNTFHIIWGPPGTGKTFTISKIIQSHLNDNRKVLLISNSNNSVDEALLKTVIPLKNIEFYLEGQIIRYGYPKKKEVFDELPLVILNNIIEKKSSNIIIEIEKLKITVKEIEKTIDNLSEIQKQKRNLNKEKKAIQTLIKEKKSLEPQLSLEVLKLNRISNSINALSSDLEKARNSWKITKVLKGISEQDILNKIESSRKEEKITENRKKTIIAKIDLNQENLEKYNKSYKLLQDLYLTELAKMKITDDSLANFVKKVLEEKDKTVNLISAKNKQIEQIKANVLASAKLICTTVTQTYISNLIKEKSFDTIIIDEASMISSPNLYYAISKSSSNVIIVGDFLQLPPICQTNDESSKNVLKQNIFDCLKLNNSDTISNCNFASILDIQYRMHPKICSLINTFFYDNILRDHETTYTNVIDDFNLKNNLVLIDTSERINVGTKLLKSRFNLYHSSLIYEIINGMNSSGNSIGIVSPYKPQVELIKSKFEDSNLQKIRINTIHGFQGSEEDTIIFDSVESQGHIKWSMLNDTNNEEAKFLLNVALSRAKKLIIFIANVEYINQFYKNCFLKKLLTHFLNNAIVLKSASFLPNYTIPCDDIEMYEQTAFWGAFEKSLLDSDEQVLIFSPFITLKRVNKLLKIFNTLRQKNIRICIFTRPTSEQGSINIDSINNGINALQNLGIEIFYRPKMHEKNCVIDKKFIWCGSLNILSHNSTTESMVLLKGNKFVNKFLHYIRKMYFK